MIYGGDEVSAVVLDVGSHTTRAGYAGEDCPKAVFSSSYAQVPSPDGTPGKRLFGNAVHLYRPRAVHATPLSDGIVTDWSAASDLIEHAFKDRLRLPTLEDHPLLVTEPTWNTKENKERMAEIAFENYGAPAFYSVDKAVMSAFASGKGTAMIVDVGHDVTSVTPIYDGFVLRKAVQRQPLAGSLLSKLMLDNLRATSPGAPPPVNVVPHYLVKGKTASEPGQPSNSVLYTDRLPNPASPDGPTTPSYHQAQEMRVMHEFKEGVCEVSTSTWNEDNINQRPPRLFEFPDGYNAFIGRSRLAVPEVLFNPKFLPPSITSLPLAPSAATIPSHPYSALQSAGNLFYNSLVQIDPDLHANLLSNIVVVGGSSLTQGFVDRLNHELVILAGSLKIKIHAPSSAAERIHSSWLGGSILASLGTFHQLWIGKEEWAELGSNVVHRRLGGN